MANSLYLDTNVYLSFYHFSNEDLEELKKLSVFTKSGEIILHLPEQTINEFTRNRDTKIADAIRIFNDNKLNNVFPQIIKDYEEEYNSMKESIKAFEKNKQRILEKIREDIIHKNLKADKIIDKLFSHANKIEITPDILERAKTRYDLGNPPGKKNSYGDALNWEALLTVVEDFEHFFFISDDKDYYSEFDKELFNSYLLKEWKDKMPLTEFRYYRSLSRFFKENYPNINISTEQRKEQLINDLAKSPNFQSTRKTLKELKNYDDFTTQQINNIVYSAINNNQVYWIGNDTDINQYLHDIVKDKYSLIEEDYRKSFEQKFPYNSSDEEELPF